jgi:hypothetical protein
MLKLLSAAVIILLTATSAFADARCFYDFSIESIKSNSSGSKVDVGLAYNDPKTSQSILALNTTFDLTNQGVKLLLETALMKNKKLEVCVKNADEIQKIESALNAKRKPGTPRDEYTIPSIEAISIPSLK